MRGAWCWWEARPARDEMRRQRQWRRVDWEGSAKAVSGLPLGVLAYLRGLRGPCTVRGVPGRTLVGGQGPLQVTQVAGRAEGWSRGLGRGQRGALGSPGSREQPRLAGACCPLSPPPLASQKVWEEPRWREEGRGQHPLCQQRPGFTDPSLRDGPCSAKI